MAIHCRGPRWKPDGGGRLPERDQNLLSSRNLIHGSHEGSPLDLQTPLLYFNNISSR